MAKTVQPVKAKQAPKEKKTLVKVLTEKLTKKKVEEIQLPEEVDEMLSVNPIVEEVAPTKTEQAPQIVVPVTDKEEEKRMKKYALLGGLDYYLNNIKGK